MNKTKTYRKMYNNNIVFIIEHSKKKYNNLRENLKESSNIVNSLAA